MIAIKPPNEVYPDLFEAVQDSHVFTDSKTFVDAVPRDDPAAIVAAYRARRDAPGFDLAKFVAERFELPGQAAAMEADGVPQPLRERIESLWGMLQRAADSAGLPGSSLIPLPRPYIVPGGRFREVYYWDSYFTMLGLARSGHIDLIQDMVDNFSWLIDHIGFIPNGNRTYYCTRSQPPIFALMVGLLAKLRDEPEIRVRYLVQMRKEYAFWMAGAEATGDGTAAQRRAVAVPGGVLNRYWDDSEAPRAESHAEDLHLARAYPAQPGRLFRNLRAACESGWDFSSRWLADGRTLASIRTTDVLPVDLNAILWHLETTLAQSCELAGLADEARSFRNRAELRGELLRERFFDPETGCFTDLLLPDLRPSGVLSLACAFPLFFGIASPAQAESVSRTIAGELLRPGGWVTTPTHSGQQWDAPNGWAPLQWVVYEGLRKCGFADHAETGARRWVENNRRVYESTGALFEKYDVETIGTAAGGGEYAVQPGFGWTNGVLLALMDQLGMP